jgi:hypothetical protein
LLQGRMLKMRGGIVSKIRFHCQDTLVHNDNLWAQNQAATLD